MSLFDYLRGQRKKNSATQAKERLSLVLAHQRANRDAPDYLPKMQEEILQVISKYVQIDRQNLQIQLDKTGDYEVLELNLVLPERD